MKKYAILDQNNEVIQIKTDPEYKNYISYKELTNSQKDFLELNIISKDEVYNNFTEEQENYKLIYKARTYQSGLYYYLIDNGVIIDYKGLENRKLQDNCIEFDESNIKDERIIKFYLKKKIKDESEKKLKELEEKYDLAQWIYLTKDKDIYKLRLRGEVYDDFLDQTFKCNLYGVFRFNFTNEKGENNTFEANKGNNLIVLFGKINKISEDNKIAKEGYLSEIKLYNNTLDYEKLSNLAINFPDVITLKIP